MITCTKAYGPPQTEEDVKQYPAKSNITSPEPIVETTDSGIAPAILVHPTLLLQRNFGHSPKITASASN